jgi:hypothetical protein
MRSGNSRSKLSSVHPRKPQSVDMPHLLPKFSKNVRVSSNAKDTDINLIMDKLIKNRIAHADFDPQLGATSIRKYIRGLVFQGSELAPY